MPRDRMLRVSFWDSESVGRLSFGARLLFQCTWNFCDDEGYIKWNPGYLRGCAFRFDDHIKTADVKKFMAEIEAEGMVRPYIPKGEVNTYGECTQFLRYQTINHPSKSKLPKPEPDDYSVSPTVDVPEGSYPNDVKLRQRRVKKTEYTDAFEVFWNAYPNRKAKLAAFKAWQKVDTSLHPTIMEKLALHCKSQAWLKDGGQFVPHASTWLNQQRWEDEINDNVPVSRKKYFIEDLPRLRAQVSQAKKDVVHWKAQIAAFGDKPELIKNRDDAQRVIAELEPEIKRLEVIR